MALEMVPFIGTSYIRKKIAVLAGNFDPLIFVGVMPLGTSRIFVNQITELRKY